MDDDKDDSQISVSDNTAFISVPGKAARTVKAGEILGDNYELLELLGLGGMGVVYRCRHLIMGHEYALKILSPHMVNEFSWKRFEVEGKVIAKLSHPNIVKIYNMGVYEGDCPFYVMELLSGMTLEEYVDKHGPLNNTETLALALKLSEALAYAHSKGIVHRDLKPSNVMLPEGNVGSGQSAGSKFAHVKIVDFGLAKLIGKQDYAGQSLTNAGDVFGSPLYMSPEQGMGRAIDGRSDIYSLGCTLYKLLTGDVPFHGANSFKTLLMHQQDALPSMSATAPDREIAPLWQSIIEKMTAKNPGARYQSMEQLHHDLERLKAGKEITAYGAEFQADKNKAYGGRTGRQELKADWWRNRAVVSLCILLALVSATFAVLNLWPKPKVVMAKAAPREIAISSFALDPKIDGDIEPTTRRKIEADFKSYQGRAARLSREAGEPTYTMYFPNTAVGTVSNGQKTLTARNTVQIPIKGGLYFGMKASVNRCTFDFPWILKKVDGNVFASVNLDRASYSSAIGFLREEGEKDPYDLDKIIEIICSWPHVAQLDMDEFDLDGPAGASLDKAPRITNIYLKKSHIHDETFRGHRFVDRLEALFMHECQNVDGALKYLTARSALTHVQLESTKPSAESLRCLSKCSHLVHVGLEQCPMTEAHWQALAQFPKLEFLGLRHIKLDAAQLEKLPCLTAATKLVISDNCIGASQLPGLRRKYPLLNVYQEQRLFSGPTTRAIFNNQQP